MNGSRKDKQVREIRLWTYAGARKAIPFLRSVTESVREHWLALQQATLRLRRLDAKPGRDDVARLLEREHLALEKEQAERNLEDALGELVAVDVFSLDPSGGLALIPFRHGEQLAWLLFDRFDPDGLHSWRFHDDPLEMQRPMADAIPVAPSREKNVSADSADVGRISNPSA